MGLDYAAMIADLEAKKAAIENSIASLRLAAGSPIGSSASDASSQATIQNDRPMELPVGAFLNMSFPAAIKLFLSATKRKQTIREIATALKNGGMESLSDNFESVVTGALNRMKTNDPPEVLRFSDGWALAENYPESFRNRLAQSAKPVAKTKKKPKKVVVAASKKEKSKKPIVEAPGTINAAGEGHGPEIMIEKFFSENAGVEFTAQAAAGALGIRTQTVGLLAAKLAHRGLLEKTPEGKYRSVRVEQIQKAG
jgi:hypothetical protein